MIRRHYRPFATLCVVWALSAPGCRAQKITPAQFAEAEQGMAQGFDFKPVFFQAADQGNAAAMRDLGRPFMKLWRARAKGGSDWFSFACALAHDGLVRGGRVHFWESMDAGAL